MGRELREVVYVDGVRTDFGKAGQGGLFWQTRADDMAVKTVRELLRRNPQAPAERIARVRFASRAFSVRSDRMVRAPRPRACRRIRPRPIGCAITVRRVRCASGCGTLSRWLR